MESLIAIVSHASAAGFFPWLAQAKYGAHYEKKFDALPPAALGDGLMFIGSCVALGLLAAWLMHEESRGGRRKRRPAKGSDAAVISNDVQAPAAVKRGRRRGKAKEKAGQKEKA